MNRTRKALRQNRWHRYLWLSMRHDERLLARERAKLSSDHDCYPDLVPYTGRFIVAIMRSVDQDFHLLGLDRGRP